MVKVQKPVRVRENMFCDEKKLQFKIPDENIQAHKLSMKGVFVEGQKRPKGKFKPPNNDMFNGTYDRKKKAEAEKKKKKEAEAKKKEAV